MGSLKDKYAIVGIGQTEVGKLPHMTSIGISVEACKRALKDAGMDIKDIDGILSQPAYIDPTFMSTAWLAENLNMTSEFTADLNLGGATPIVMIEHAILAIESGICSAVLCCYGERQRISMERTPTHGRIRFGTEDFEWPYGLIMPAGSYALGARRHMYEYGTKSEQLGAIAVACRKHACLNPGAQMQTPLTIEDYLKSPMFVEPFHTPDLCLISDGGGAVIVTSAERARDLKSQPIFISGIGEGLSKAHLSDCSSLTTFEGIKTSARKAFDMAEISLEDIDMAEFYDCFTYTVLVQIEDYGFCKKGEGGSFVEGGRIEIGGDLPVNTHGGLLSHAHIDGMNHIIEAVVQLRGFAGRRQVKDANIALVTGNGGHIFCSHSTLILRR